MRMLWLSLGLVVLLLSGVSTAPVNEEEERLVGGVQATSKDYERFSFYVRLGEVKTIFAGGLSYTYFKTQCQGFLYDLETVVTAAHCAKFTQNLIHAVCGTLQPQTQYVTGVTLHPYFHSSHNYQGVYLPNDIAVVKLESKFTASKYCKPAKLPSCASSTYYNQNVTVFGFNTNGHHTLWYLMNWVTVSMTVMPGQACYTKYLGQWYNRRIQECLIDVEGTQAACLKDHGTAALTADNTLIGIGSWMLNSCLQGNTSVPSVYVRVAHYVSWIAYAAYPPPPSYWWQ